MMDDEYIDPEEDADAMARFMGFASFGTQGPTKKRKFNPSTDAVVDGQALAALDKGGKKGQGSGGNDVPLGKIREIGVAKVVERANDDEIDLDLDEEGGEEGGASLAVEADGVEEGEEDEGPVYIDTSRPPPSEVSEEAKAAKAAQDKIDAILAEASSTPSTPPQTTKGQITLPGRGIGQFMSALRDPPPVPSPSTISAPEINSPLSGRGHRPGERGQRSELWYVGYYDQSFNENPWARLEGERGLLPRGSWVEREQRVS